MVFYKPVVVLTRLRKIAQRHSFAYRTLMRLRKIAKSGEKNTAIMAEEIREIKRQGFSKELSLELYRASMADYPKYAAQFNIFIDFMNANWDIIDP